jgi:F0F1-type ATP synthase delta subunit
MDLKDIFVLVVIQIGTFVVLFVGLRILFYQHLNFALKRLKKLQEETIVKEATLQEELERAREERMAEVEQGKQEAKEIIEKAKKDADKVRLKIEEEGRAEKQKIIAAGKEEAQKMGKKLVADMETKAVNLAVEVIRCIFTEKDTSVLQRQLIEEVIEEVGQLDKSMFATKMDKVKVITSFSLTDKEKESLKKILSNKMGGNIVLEEEKDIRLIGGLVIKMGQFVIDGSFENKLRKIIPMLQKD